MTFKNETFTEELQQRITKQLDKSVTQERRIMRSDFNGKQKRAVVRSILKYTGVTQLCQNLLCNTLNFECKYSSNTDKQIPFQKENGARNV